MRLNKTGKSLDGAMSFYCFAAVDQPLAFSPIFGPNDSPSPAAHRAPVLPALEKALIALCSIQLGFLPWAFGGVHVWAQWINLGLSLVCACFSSALTRQMHPTRRSRLQSLQPCWRSPHLLAAVALGLYVLIQLANPAWQFKSNDASWWLEPLNYIKWLPHSIAAPFNRFNAWHWALVIFPLCLTLLSISRGFSRRRSYAILLAVVAVNGGLVAFVGILQRLAHATKIFGAYPSSNYRFFASFIYPNHAGAFLNLTLGAAVAIGFYQSRTILRAAAAPVIILWLFVTALIATAVGFSASRMSIGLALLSLALFGVCPIFRVRAARVRVRKGSIFASAVTAAVLSAILTTVLVAQRGDRLVQRLSALTNHPAAALRARTLAQRAGWEMFQAHPLLGWGAGSFRYGFPIYLQNYPEIYKSGDGQLNYWEHVHDDWLEGAIELGALGILPIAFIILKLGADSIRTRIWKSALPLFLAIAAIMTLLHATVDFVFHCPAVLFTWSVLVLTALRWRKLEIAQIASAGKAPTV